MTQIDSQARAQSPLQSPEVPKVPTEHVEDVEDVDPDLKGVRGVDRVGLAVIEQKTVIPQTGERMITSQWEYWLFCVFCFSNQGIGINTNGGALRQNLINRQFPDGWIPWAGKKAPLNSVLLDLTGITFAVQLCVLLLVGPYADYGNWRPWILISFSVVAYVVTFGMIGVSHPSQWQIAQVLVTLGGLSLNICVAFFQATFPGVVRNLPVIVESEDKVLRGEKSAEEHAKLDMYERAQLYNWVNSIGSLLVVITTAIAVGISARIGFDTDEKLVYSYRVLLGYFGAISVLCGVPFFIVNKHRPGQQLPSGSKWYSVGPRQVWQAAKSARRLKYCLMYLLAYFMLQETWGTTGQVIGILQNEILNYSPLKINALQLVGDLGGGSGTFAVLLLQRKFRFSIKTGAFYGACLTLTPSVWGLIGCYTHKIGFHHDWEFWLAAAYNFATGAWGSYSVTMISEVVPAPKAFLFFALFNTVGKTSAFIGPLISSAIIQRAGGNTNYCFWFLFIMGFTGCCVLWFVDTDKAKLDVTAYLEQEAEELYTAEQRENAMPPILQTLDRDQREA